MRPRRKKKPPESPPPDDDARTERANAVVDDFLSHASRRPRRENPPRPIDLAVKEADRRGASGDWEGAGGRAFVGLYALCHLLVYGVIPVDLADRAVYGRATKAATKCLHEHFGDDRAEFVEFIRWSWEREKGREEWADRKGVQRGRLGVFVQFSASVVTDYRVDQSRRARRGRR